ncbi:MAG: DMT family transporter [Betaproteobacteria bacterium]|nr:DMT family transporter [Betaproteobacteria bacterium]PWB60898.1 MAG: EamA family transporter [Betaproteobacteria bacterium]
MPSHGRSASGITLIVVSACAFGAMAIFTRFAYASGANVTGVLTARFAIAGALLAGVMVATGRAWPRGRPLLVAIGMGAIGYVGQAMCFFSALNHASAGLVALLLYAYPTLVVLLSAVFLGDRLTVRKLALLAFSFGGLALTLGGGHGTQTGIALGLGAAAFYSVYIVVGARELARTDALASTTVVCLSAAAALALSAPFTEPRFPGAAWGWPAIGAIAIVSTVIAILTFFAGLKRVGPAVASVVSTLEPVVTVVLAWLILGETLGLAQLAGGAVVLACAALLARSR